MSRRLRLNELPSDAVQICNLTCEFVDPAAFRLGHAYICHPILDAGATDAAELLSFARSLTPPGKGRLLIHCANGHGRTGMCAAVWLLAHGYAASADEAVKLIQKVRQGVSLRPRQYQLVRAAASLLSPPVEPAGASGAAVVGGAMGETHGPPPA